MSVAPYPEYKDSGVEWIGSIPRHWAVGRFKHLLRERDARSDDGAETLLSVSAYTGVTPRSDIIDSDEHLTRAESLVGYKIVQPDDLVINIMLAWNRGLGVSNYHGIVSPAYAVFQPLGALLPTYAHYALRSDEYIKYFKAYSTGVIDSRLRIYPEVFLGLKCALPPIPDQSAIAAFLDQETGKIDALVAEQERLIALLKEKRQAVISQAVTKGLNPNAPMKDSGIEWLGQVPAHWTITKTSYLFKSAMGQTILAEELVEDGEWPVFSATEGDHYFGRINNPEVRLDAGDIVIPARGNSIGHVKLVREPSTTTQTTIYCKLRKSEKVMARFAYHCPSSNHLRPIGALSNGVSGPSVVEVKLPFGDASSGGAGWCCA